MIPTFLALARGRRQEAGVAIVVFASALHMLWAASLFVSPAALASTPLAMLTEMFVHRYLVVVVLLGASLLAMYGLVVRSPTCGMLSLLPQQTLLIMSGLAGLLAARRGVYADGTVISTHHIFADQVVYGLLAAFYMAAVALDHASQTLSQRFTARRAEMQRLLDHE